ncbi:MAG: hypothetical protein ABL973_16875 [Micropepsaceae bacterium]
MDTARVLAITSALTVALSAQSAYAEWSPVGNWETGGVKTYPIVARTGAARGKDSSILAVHVCLTSKSASLKGWLGLSESTTANMGNPDFIPIFRNVSDVRAPACSTVTIPKEWKSIYLNFQEVDLNKPASGTYQVETL